MQVAIVYECNREAQARVDNVNLAYMARINTGRAIIYDTSTVTKHMLPREACILIRIVACVPREITNRDSITLFITRGD